MGVSRVKSHPKADIHTVLLLDAPTVRQVLSPGRALAALDGAYRGLHAAPGDAGQSLGFQVADGKFHVKSGLLPKAHTYFAAKINANFPMNGARSGLPTIQGLVLLADGADGRPLAVLHSGELTALRTAAATALAARHGARKGSRNLAIIGCGAQARHQAAAVAAIRPISGIAAFDTDADRARAFAEWAREALGILATVAPSVAQAASGADIIVTCTTGTQVILTPDMPAPGCFIAAVGADNPDKQEIDPALFARARILVDDRAQCASGGDLAHALRAGAVPADIGTASLAELAGGAKPGRVSDEEIVLFDSTGTGVQDVAAAAAAYEGARELGLGTPFKFAG